MNRTNVLTCIHRHLHAARMESGGLRPLGELIPRIAAELRAGVDTSHIQVSTIPLPLVAAFVDGFVSPEEELTVCRSILVDNSILAELVAGVLALEETLPNANALPPLSNDLTARLLGLTSQALSQPADELVEGDSQIDAVNDEQEQQLLRTPIRKSVTTRDRARSEWLKATLAVLAVAASLLLIVWWAVKQSPFGQVLDQTVQVPVQQEMREPMEPTAPDESQNVSPRDDGLAVQTPVEHLTMPPVVPPKLNQQDRSPELPQVVVTPSPPLISPPEEFIAAPMTNIQWKKISGLLARRNQNPDYSDETGWQGVSPGDDVAEASDTTQLLTLPMSRAEADIASGGSIVLAADTRLTFAQGAVTSSAKVGLSHGLIAFVDMPQNTAIEFTDSDRALATVKWTGTKATLLVTVTDAGLQAQVTGGEVVINHQNVRNSVVSIDSQSINDLKDRNTRLPAWVSRPIDSIPLSKMVLGQLAGADNLAETLDRLLEASASAGEADNGRLVLSSWRASLSDSNLLRIAEGRSPLVRIQALQRLMVLPEWDVRYKHSWAKFAITINNEAEIVFLRQTFELTRRGGKLNAVQIAQLGKMLESPQLALRSLSDFILRKNFGGGPQFDPNLNPQANTRGIGLWKRYINAIRNNAL